MALTQLPPSLRARGVKAVLGPTNTGKTHLAIERMLAHPTGIIGLPLRLLAREVYGRIVARIGKDAVALVTGAGSGIGRACALAPRCRATQRRVCRRSEIGLHRRPVLGWSLHPRNECLTALQRRAHVMCSPARFRSP